MPVNREASRKAKQLQKLRRESISFFKEIYRENEKILVFGEGNPDASLVLVGEAPGHQEVVQQRPFVGQAGQNLNEFLGILGIKREDIYITNAVKFRPTRVDPTTGRVSNRPPNKEEIELCRSLLYKELSIIHPVLVVSLGNIPLKVLADDNKIAIGQVHGTPIDIAVGEEGLKMTLFPLYHPASIIYRPQLKEVYLEDVERLKRYLQDIGVL
ncbi:DNA polymerase [Caldicoprobacter guelmensis]|uniref:uracil-DNA glycosylase n=1 Tax=Caldicoprobacter guelmensis TaxID=1170224 RepID=UPI00195BA14B|nr:DNA polymerase [Caldicoprobacter guelmensis]